MILDRCKFCTVSFSVDLVMIKNVFLDRVVHQIGHGSFGVVVSAMDRMTNSAVAVKVLHKDEDLQDDLELEERLYRKLLAGCNRRVEYVLIFLPGTAT